MHMGKLISAILVLVIGIIALVYVFDPYQKYKESSLKSFNNTLTKSIEKHDCTAIYQLKNGEYKARVTFDKFIFECSASKKPKSDKINVHKIWVVNDTGFVDRTRISCLTQACTEKDRVVDRSIKRYFFKSGNWTLSDEDNPLKIESN